MSAEQSGSLPKPGDVQYLQRAAEKVKETIPDGYGFILLVAPFGEDVRLGYISTIERKAAINILKEWLIKASGPEEWMKHLQ